MIHAQLWRVLRPLVPWLPLPLLRLADRVLDLADPRDLTGPRLVDALAALLPPPAHRWTQRGPSSPPGPAGAAFRQKLIERVARAHRATRPEPSV